MAHISVGTRSRPLNSKIDDESFTLKDEKDEQYVFSFDKLFYDDSGQADVYEILGRPIVRGVKPIPSASLAIRPITHLKSMDEIKSCDEIEDWRVGINSLGYISLATLRRSTPSHLSSPHFQL
ncbi:kinesin-like protein KIN-1 [Tanacetum coccineum]